jgi:hypothetical protein
MSFRVLENGDLIAVIRGSAPTPPDGYIQNIKNKYLYHPILTPCEFRMFKNKEKKCCKNKFITKLYCKSRSDFITQKDCMRCMK